MHLTFPMLSRKWSPKSRAVSAAAKSDTMEDEVVVAAAVCYEVASVAAAVATVEAQVAVPSAESLA